MESGTADRGPTAVLFDLWGTLVPFRHAAWDEVLAETASALGADLGEFLAAWHADYANRAVGELEPSLRRVCRQARVIPDDARIRHVLELRRTALAGISGPRDLWGFCVGRKNPSTHHCSGLTAAIPWGLSG